MKRLIILSAVLGLCAAGAQAQGLINFANGLSSLVTVNGSNAPVGTKVELLYQPGGPNVPAPVFNWYFGGGIGGWEPATGMEGNTFTLGTTNGRFAAGTQTTGADVAPGVNAWFTVVEWTGGFSTFEGAIAGGGEVGESTVFELTTGGGSTPPAAPVSLTAATPVNGFVAGNPFSGVAIMEIPEPSVIVLSSLGAAFILLRRRKK